MNETGNKFLTAEIKSMPEMHLRQPGITYSACGTLTKCKKEYKNLKKQEIRCIYPNKLDKACLQYNIGLDDFTD